ncbi:hypothetical protein KBC70_01455, partial [Candidatus Woesebacteria bacterium]|nr:hypothetical protein [Candidatus Woesebacteria bacterium]
ALGRSPSGELVSALEIGLGSSAVSRQVHDIVQTKCTILSAGNILAGQLLVNVAFPIPFLSYLNPQILTIISQLERILIGFE